MKFFHLFVIGKEGKEKVSDNILDTKKASHDYKNKELKNTKIWGFSKGIISPWFWSKIGNFTCFYFRQNRPGKCVSRYSKKVEALVTPCNLCNPL